MVNHFAVGISTIVVTAAIKYLLVGKYRVRTAPLWSSFVWCSELITSNYENITVALFLSWFTVSTVYVFFMRFFGC